MALARWLFERMSTTFRDNCGATPTNRTSGQSGTVTPHRLPAANVPQPHIAPDYRAASKPIGMPTGHCTFAARVAFRLCHDHVLGTGSIFRECLLSWHAQPT